MRSIPLETIQLAGASNKLVHLKVNNPRALVWIVVAPEVLTQIST
jgi:hypothetical protein